MVRIISCTLFALVSLTAQAQLLSPERSTAWELAGNTTTISASDNVVSILNFGADATGVAPSNAAYSAAIAALNGAAGTILFPEGQYYFTTDLLVPDSVFLQGESAASVLKIDLGNTSDLIRMAGSISATPIMLSQAAERGTSTLVIDDATTLAVGDVIRLSMTDNDLMFSDWAYGQLGQIVAIAAIEGNTLTLEDPLNTYYPMSRAPKVFKVTPTRAAGVECLSIQRLDNAAAQVSNINIRASYNCLVRNVYSTRCDYAHVNITTSAHISVEGCYFNQAIGYGGGGQGYGVMVEETSSFCHIQNNIFDRLRHSMILQGGANGNVFGYNFSRDPNWVQSGYPANSAGDVVMHGNYPYMNLFEGNTVQNIAVDASHGINGPFNTFFRNRVGLYGFISDNSTVTDSMNVIGNEIPNMGFFMGNFSLNGAGHFSHGNHVRGDTIPTATHIIGEESLLYSNGSYPAYMDNSLPYIGFPLAVNANTTPANTRYLTGTYVSCAEDVVTGIAEENLLKSIPELMGNQLYVPTEMLPAQYTVYGMDGRIYAQRTIHESITNIASLSSGLYVIRLSAIDGTITNWKIAAGF
jgi:hypothetical protein